MQRFVINTIWTRGISTFVNFLIALLIARHAGPVIKGEVTLLITTIWFFIFLSNILGGQALVYLIPRNRVELLVIPAYAWSLAVSLLGFSFLKFTHVIAAKHVPAIAALSFLSSIISINQTVLLAKEKISEANILTIIPLLLQALGIAGCFYILHISDSYAYIYASFLGYSVSLFVSLWLTKDVVPFSAFRNDFSLTDMNISFRYGFLFQLVEILQLLNLRYYFYSLALQEGSRYLGVYSIGISILEAVWIIPRGISTVHYVATSNASAVMEQRKNTVQFLKISCFLCAVCLIAIWMIPSAWYVFVFGPGFKDVKHSMRFLLPGVFIYNIVFVISSYYFGLGKYRPLILSHLAGFISLSILSASLIPRYVMSGAGLAASLSFTLAATILLGFFMRDKGKLTKAEGT